MYSLPVVVCDLCKLLSSLAINGILKAWMVCVKSGAIHEHILCIIQVRDLAREPVHLVDIWDNGVK